MKIGELSKQTGVIVRMLRYYEEHGLLKPNRTHAGYRDFDSKEVRTIERIKLLSAAGMNLATILQFLPCIRGDEPIFEPCDELRQLLREQIKISHKKSEELAESRKTLEGFLYQIENS
ncbi:MerR family transcriptional regulator [Vibrio penaeicida]|uniref:MerR family transcriptional regulator n=1 Tax=Vibrio penaeicida TaxID=104609 RepID=UPI000CE9CD79|nr:MerR family transcriptional regulator [Vibrio penaeicida]